MKKALIFLSLFLVTFISCKEDVCEFNDPVCEEVAPIDEECLAYFERWFYDSSTSACEKIAYSGCGQYGFSTKEDCELCECND